MGDKSYRIVVVVCIFATVGCLGYIVRDKVRFESPVPRLCYSCRSATNKSVWDVVWEERQRNHRI